MGVHTHESPVSLSTVTAWGLSLLEQDPLDEPAEVLRDEYEPETLFVEGSSRPAIGMFAVVLGLLAVWMFYIIRISLDGDGWFDLIVGFVLRELIIALGLFATLLLLWAIFAPGWISRVYAAACRKLVLALAFVGLLFGSAILFLVMGPVLVFLGILR
jgi:hypothetical protein